MMDWTDRHCRFVHRLFSPNALLYTEMVVAAAIVRGPMAFMMDEPLGALDAEFRKALRPFYPHIDTVRLEDYKVRIIGGQLGTAARTRVLIVSTDGKSSWGTVGVSDNIIEASWLALSDSLEYALLGRD